MEQDWKLKSAYEALGLMCPVNATVNTLELTAYEFEKIVKKISYEYYDKAQSICFLILCLKEIDHKAYNNLEIKAFVPYEDFLRFHQLKYLDWTKRRRSYYAEFDPPEALNHPDFHFYFKEVLQIQDEQDYYDFVRTYPPNVHGYMALLRRSASKKLHTFLKALYKRL